MQSWRWSESETCTDQYCVHIKIICHKKYFRSSTTDICVIFFYFFFFLMQDVLCYSSRMCSRTCKPHQVLTGKARSNVNTHTQGGAAGLTQGMSCSSTQTSWWEKIPPWEFLDFPLSECSTLHMSAGQERVVLFHRDGASLVFCFSVFLALISIVS